MSKGHDRRLRMAINRLRLYPDTPVPLVAYELGCDLATADAYHARAVAHLSTLKRPPLAVPVFLTPAPRLRRSVELPDGSVLEDIDGEAWARTDINGRRRRLTDLENMLANAGRPKKNPQKP